MITLPCKDCKERKVGCHSICEKYKEYQTDRIITNRLKKQYLASASIDFDHYNRMKGSRKKR